MKVKKVKIGDFETENNVFFAPLAGFSDFAMREICKEYGAGLTFTEMVSAKGLVFGDENPVCPACRAEATEKLISKPCRHCEGGSLGDFGAPSAPSSGGGCAGCSGGNCASCH